MPSREIRSVIVALKKDPNGLVVLDDDPSREDDELEADGEEGEGGIDGRDAMDEGAGDADDLRQLQRDFAPEGVAAAAVEDADLGGDDAAHGGDGGEQVFAEREPELRAVVRAEGEVVQQGAQEPRFVDEEFRDVARFEADGGHEVGDQ